MPVYVRSVSTWCTLFQVTGDVPCVSGRLCVFRLVCRWGRLVRGRARPTKGVHSGGCGVVGGGWYVVGPALHLCLLPAPVCVCCVPTWCALFRLTRGLWCAFSWLCAGCLVRGWAGWAGFVHCWGRMVLGVGSDRVMFDLRFGLRAVLWPAHLPFPVPIYMFRMPT